MGNLNDKIAKSNKFVIISGLFILLVLSGSIVYYFLFEKVSKTNAGSLEEYAEIIVKKCATAQYKPTCYEDEVPKTMDILSMEETFEVTRLIQEKDRSYAYCHVLGHKLSAKEAAKDPEKWKEIIPRCPSGLCSNGCIHGAFQERFRAESLPAGEIDKIKPDLKHICEPKSNWSPTGLERGTCYHALGHLLMYITDADIKKSNELCKEVAVDFQNHDWSPLCFDGVFMQLFQPLEPDDFALIAGKEIEKEELVDFCSEYQGQQWNSCWSEGWPLYRDEIMESEGLYKFCSGTSGKSIEDQKSCYLDLFYVLTAQFQFDLPKVKKLCDGLPLPWKNQCYANAASRMIETDFRNIPVVTKWCSEVASTEGKDVCFNELIFYSTYNFHAGSPQFYEICNGLPEPWKSRCLKDYK